MHVKTFFARNLGGLVHARIYVPGRLGKAISRKPSMHVDRSRMRPYYRGSDRTKGWRHLAEEGRASPKGNSRQAVVVQRSTAQVLSAIYEQDFSPCSFGGRPGLGAHHALATITDVIAGSKAGWVLEADLKNFFGSLNHDWLLRFVEHRVGDPRLISLIRRWLKAGVADDGEVYPNEE